VAPAILTALTIPVFATLAGGLLAVRFRHLRPLLIACGAGLLLGAAFLDLLPEAIVLGADGALSATDVLGLTLGFFLLFVVAESLLRRWAEGQNEVGIARRTSGKVAGSLLIFHSFRDGMAIGAAFAASHPAGFAVAAGITAHDLGDGMNTVLLTTGGEPPTRTDYAFLAADAIAPLLGGLLTAWWTVSPRYGVVLLALAAGFFLQMATSDFLPELRGQRLNGKLVTALVGGAAFVYVTNQLLLSR